MASGVIDRCSTLGSSGPGIDGDRPGPVLRARPSPVTSAVGVRVKLTSRGTKPPSLRRPRSRRRRRPVAYVVAAAGTPGGGVGGGGARRPAAASPSAGVGGRRRRRRRRRGRRRAAGRATWRRGAGGGRMAVRRSRGPARFPASLGCRGAADHAASSSTTRGATTTFIPDLLGVAARRSAVGRAVARHPPQRSGHAGRRAPAGRRHGTAPLPAQGAGRRRAAVAAGPSERGSRRRPGSPPGATRTPSRSRSCCCALTPFDGVLRRPPDRRHARRCSTSSAPTSWPRPCAAHGPARGAGRAVPRPLPRRPDRRRRRGQRPARGAVGARGWPTATPATPASPSRCCSTSSTWHPARRSSSGPGNLHAYLGGAGIELMGASDNVVRGGLTTKPVDVDDLLAVLDPTPLAEPVMAAGRATRAQPARRSACCASTARRRTHGRRPRAGRHDRRPHRLPRPRRAARRRRRASTSPPPTSPPAVTGATLGASGQPTVLRISTIFSVAWLASAPWASSSGLRSLAASRSASAVSARAIAASTPCSLMNSAHSTSDDDHLVLGHDGDVAALDEQVAALVAGGDAEVGLAGLARAVDDAAHHGDLQRQLPLAERLHRPLGDVDHVDLGPPARRAGDEVDVLALAQAERLEQLAPGPRLLDRVGGQRVADRVADALEQQRGDAGRRLDQPGGRRAGLGDPEVQRVVGDLRRAGGRPRPSAARSTP